MFSAEDKMKPSRKRWRFPSCCQNVIELENVVVSFIYIQTLTKLRNQLFHMFELTILVLFKAFFSHSWTRDNWECPQNNNDKKPGHLVCVNFNTRTWMSLRFRKCKKGKWGDMFVPAKAVDTHSNTLTTWF